MMQDFLKQFENRGSPCAMFHPKEMSSIVREIKRACENGWLTNLDTKLPSGGDSIWWTETFILTDDGLVYCGLKKPQQKVKGLFDE